MGSKSLKQNPKERNKTQNPMDPIQLPGSHANAAKRLCHRAGLSLALAPRKKIPNLKYLDPTTTVET
jgi:hypothetical protein